MSPETLIHLAAIVALIGLMAYAVLGGADFGGGVWSLFATGPRKEDQRRAIAAAMGPVWEANHVWLIFVIVVLFTAFPYGYAPLGIALFLPFHLALLGIMLRGAAFVFRGYGHGESSWGMVFGVASTITPFLLGCAFGAITAGGVEVVDGHVKLTGIPWLTPYSIGCGLLALSTCAYLAGVYLTWETQGDLRDDFRRRAIIAGTTTAALAFIVLALAYIQARWFFQRLLAPAVWPVLGAGLFFFAASAWAVFTRKYALSRIFAAGEIVLLLLGWGLAQQPWLIYPNLTLTAAAAPAPTIAFLLWTLPFGGLILVPSLWYLFWVFKGNGTQVQSHA